MGRPVAGLSPNIWDTEPLRVSVCRRESEPKNETSVLLWEIFHTQKLSKKKPHDVLRYCDWVVILLRPMADADPNGVFFVVFF